MIARALVLCGVITVGVGVFLVALGKPSLATIWLTLGLVDVVPIVLAAYAGTTRVFAFTWMATALLRMPAGLMLASWFKDQSEAITALPYLYLVSLLCSAGLAAMVVRSGATSLAVETGPLMADHTGSCR